MAVAAALALFDGSDSEDDDEQVSALPPVAADHPTFAWVRRLWPSANAAGGAVPATTAACMAAACADAAARLGRDVRARAPALIRALRDTGGAYAADAASAFSSSVESFASSDDADALLAILARGPCAARAKDCDALCATAREERGGFSSECWRVVATLAIARPQQLYEIEMPLVVVGSTGQTHMGALPLQLPSA